MAQQDPTPHQSGQGALVGRTWRARDLLYQTQGARVFSPVLLITTAKFCHEHKEVFKNSRPKLDICLENAPNKGERQVFNFGHPVEAIDRHAPFNAIFDEKQSPKLPHRWRKENLAPYLMPSAASRWSGPCLGAPVVEHRVRSRAARQWPQRRSVACGQRPLSPAQPMPRYWSVCTNASAPMQGASCHFRRIER